MEISVYHECLLSVLNKIVLIDATFLPITINRTIRVHRLGSHSSRAENKLNLWINFIFSMNSCSTGRFYVAVLRKFRSKFELCLLLE